MRNVSFAFALALVTGSVAGQTAWGPRPPGVDPPARYAHAMTWDAARREIVLFGGESFITQLDDTWVWRGEWTRRYPTTAPSARTMVRAVFDAARGVVVMFGGYDGTSYLDETWEWDGRDWALRTPAHKPPALGGHALAYDPGRERVVLFGGFDGFTSHDETWEWDGTDWQDKTPPTKPAARWGMGFCFDIGRGVCLMFGGRLDGTGIFYNDTWTWNGGAWTRLSPPESPSERVGTSMVYDPTRDRIVLFGGLHYLGPPYERGDTWEWDGATWLPRSFGPGPAPRGRHVLEFDHATGRVVLFGGAEWILTVLGDTWEYFNLTPARFEPLGPGCAGSAGVPILEPVGKSVPWIGETFELDLRPIPSSVLATPFVLLGASNELWGGVPLPLELGVIGMPGCWLQVSIDISLPLPNHGGWTGLPLPIPYDYRLLGAPLFTQAFVLDPGATPPAAVSNAGLLVIGAK